MQSLSFPLEKVEALRNWLLLKQGKVRKSFRPCMYSRQRYLPARHPEKSRAYARAEEAMYRRPL